MQENPAMQRTRYLVLGAGVSGLAFADWLHSDELIICEADGEPGGYCKTVRQNGFTWDYSGHFFHFRHKHIEDYLVQRMKQQRVLTIRKDSRIWYGDRFIDFPFQKNIHQLPQAEFIECLYDLYFRPEGTTSNFRDMLYAKFGKGITEKFLTPYNQKLYATDLSLLDAEAMGRFFPHADVEAIVRNFREPDNSSYNSTFTYPEGGAIQYIEALLQHVKPEQLRLNEAVLNIDLRNKVATTRSGEIAFEHLVSSAPIDRLLDLCKVPHDKQLYSYNKVLVFNLGFDRKGMSGVHWIYVPQPEIVFYRVGFYDNIFDADRMSLYVEIGYRRDAVIDAQVIETARQRVLEDLKKVGILSDQRLVASHHVVLDPAYVHITTASNHDVATKKRLLETCGVHSMGRYGSWTYCSIEDNIVEARALADTFNALEDIG